MKVFSIALLMVAASLSLAGGHGRQGHNFQNPTPLKGMEYLIGDWAGTQKFVPAGDGPTEGAATAHISKAIANRYIEERLSTKIIGRKASDTRHFMIYDSKAGKYRAWWFNDTAVGPTEFAGDAHGNQIVLESIPKATGPGPGTTLRATYTKLSATKYSLKLEVHLEDHWRELFTTTYKKKG